MKLNNKIKIIIISFVVLVFSLLAVAVNKDDFFSRKSLKQLKKNYGKTAYKRGLALNKLIKNLQDKPDKVKVIEINRFFNNLKYETDDKVWKKKDYWASPIEFVGKNKGDCEDFVISKYFSLRKLGIKDKKLFLTYVKAEKQNIAHMVLSYFEKANKPPLILDNYNKLILVATKRTDLKPVYSFNANALFLSNASAGVGKYLPTDKVKNSKWERLLAELEK